MKPAMGHTFSIKSLFELNNYIGSKLPEERLIVGRKFSHLFLQDLNIKIRVALRSIFSFL